MNPVTWFSIPAEDVDRASAFYNKAFGWHVQPRTKEANDIYDYNVVTNSESDANFNPVSTARVNGCIVKKATGISTPVSSSRSTISKRQHERSWQLADPLFLKRFR